MQIYDDSIGQFLAPVNLIMQPEFTSDYVVPFYWDLHNGKFCQTGFFVELVGFGNGCSLFFNLRVNSFGQVYVDCFPRFQG